MTNEQPKKASDEVCAFAWQWLGKGRPFSDVFQTVEAERSAFQDALRALVAIGWPDLTEDEIDEWVRQNPATPSILLMVHGQVARKKDRQEIVESSWRQIFALLRKWQDATDEERAHPGRLHAFRETKELLWTWTVLGRVIPTRAGGITEDLASQLDEALSGHDAMPLPPLAAYALGVSDQMAGGPTEEANRACVAFQKVLSVIRRRQKPLPRNAEALRKAADTLDLSSLVTKDCGGDPEAYTRDVLLPLLSWGKKFAERLPRCTVEPSVIWRPDSMLSGVAYEMNGAAGHLRRGADDQELAAIQSRLMGGSISRRLFMETLHFLEKRLEERRDFTMNALDSSAAILVKAYTSLLNITLVPTIKPIEVEKFRSEWEALLSASASQTKRATDLRDRLLSALPAPAAPDDPRDRSDAIMREEAASVDLDSLARMLAVASMERPLDRSLSDPRATHDASRELRRLFTASERFLPPGHPLRSELGSYVEKMNVNLRNLCSTFWS